VSSESLTTAPVLTAKDAITRHVRWKITLQLAIQMREPLTPRAIRAIQYPDECSIGKWLLSPLTLKIRRTPEYRALVPRHEEFHAAMVEIAELINSGDFAAAERGLDPNGRFRKAAQAVACAITAVDRIQTIALGE
jgi:methyl-accepting chemotaxis protein